MKQFLFLLFAVLLLVSCEQRQQSGPPNILLIMADDLGYGDLSCYGNPTIETPHLDSLAKRGVRFMDFHANGAVCSPTRAALMTGKYQQRTGIEGVVTALNHREVGLSLAETTIAEELKQHGYRCGMFGKWHLGYAPEFNPIHQGFDEFAGFVSGNVDYHSHIDQVGYLDWWKGDQVDDEPGYTTDLITDYGVQFIRKQHAENPEQPFFLYLAHEAPHYPYQGRNSKGFREAGKSRVRNAEPDSIPGLYQEMVETMDEGIGQIIQVLKETGQFENTLILFLSDNGASASGSNGALRGHKASPYEGGSRVPAMLSYPAAIQQAFVSQQTILTMDLLPTFLDFMGEQPSAEIDGLSIKDHLLHKQPIPKRETFFSFKNKSFVRSGDWKLIRLPGEGGYTYALYDLSQDLGETTNLLAEQPEVGRELVQQLESWEREVSSGITSLTQ
ncbi:MAG: sulfatase-like hydrolase/transferase [Bacteroidota bacterium]